MLQGLESAQVLYDAVRRWFTILTPLFVPATFFIDAPFGRFGLVKNNFLVIDGIRSWIFMELVSPLCFLNAYLRSPLSPTAAGTPPSLKHPSTLLASLYVVHYLNRAIVSPLRTPSRSNSHLAVVFFAIIFNSCNGSLMGAYLSSPSALSFLDGAFYRPLFWGGVALWATGFVGNIVHDEILLDLRRSANAKGAQANGGDERKGKDTPHQHYAVPYGLLYRYISYPNYFCEWLEWLGFALAAASPPSVASLAAVVATISPPWLFFVNEIWLMSPRAYRGHRWYLDRFPDYPKERKAVIPFVY